MKDKNVRIQAHFHTTNYLEMNHHNIHSSGFKYKKDNQSYVITCAHNILETQLPPFFHGVDYICDLPITSYDKFSKVLIGHGDGDLLVIGDDENKRSILAVCNDLGAAFFDVTNSTTAGSTLIEYIPKQDPSDVIITSTTVTNNIWNQIKFNHETKYAYQQMGEQAANDTKGRCHIMIYDCTESHKNTVKLVERFNVVWNSEIIEHRRILAGVWNRLVRFSGIWQTVEEYYSWVDDQQNYIIGDCHNLQIDSKNHLLFVVDAEVNDITQNNLRVFFPTLVFDISDMINPYTGKKCSVSPLLMRILEGEAILKQLTEKEINDIVAGTERYDEDGNMILEMDMNDDRRPTIQLTELGTLPYQDVDHPNIWSNNWLNQYNHDVTVFHKDDKSYLITCYLERGWNNRDRSTFYLNNNKLRHFGMTHGFFAIYETTNLRDNLLTPLRPFQTPIHDFLKINNVRGPMDAFVHNASVNESATILFGGCEITNSRNFDSKRDFQTQSCILVYDISDLNNIRFKRIEKNFGWVKAVGYDTITNVGPDANHNFTITKYKGKEYMAVADQIDGCAVFDITDGSFKLVAKLNSVRYIQYKNPYYASDRHEPIFPWIKVYSNQSREITPSAFGAVWGVTFGPNGDLYVMSKESVSVFSLKNIGDTDIRDFKNMMTNQKFTKYPHLKVADKVTCLEPDSGEKYNLSVVHLDPSLDIAILTADNLTGGYAAMDTSIATLHDSITTYNLSHDNKVSKKNEIINDNDKVAPILISKTYEDRTSELVGFDHKSRIRFNHQLANQDVGLLGNQTKLNYVPRKIVTLPGFMMKYEVGKGSSGSGILHKGKLVGMLTSSEVYDNTSYSIGSHIEDVLSVVDRLIEYEGLPYIGIEVYQNIFDFSGYVVRNIDKSSNLYLALYNLQIDNFSLENILSKSIILELTHIDGTEIGTNSDKKKITFFYKSYTSYEGIKLKFNLWKVSEVDSKTYIYDTTIFTSCILGEKIECINQFDETSNASGNPYPDIPFYYEELRGMFL